MTGYPDYFGQDFFCHEALHPGGMAMDRPHYHNHYELYYLCSGQRRYFIDSQIYHLQPGDMVLIPPWTLHKTLPGDPLPHRRVLLGCAQSMVDGQFSPLFARRFFPRNQPADQQLQQLLAKIQREHRRGDRHSSRLLSCHLFELLCMLDRLPPGPQAQPPSQSPAEELIARAAGYIRLHCDSPLSLSAVAARYHLSSGYFSKLFVAHTGFGFRRYLNLVRIQKAQQLLRDTSLPIVQIAFGCGFADSNYFSSVFKAVQGQTPREYRRGCADNGHLSKV